MSIQQMRLRLITCGCGPAFSARKFRPIHNIEFVKPDGGLWASPIATRYGWREYLRSAGQPHEFKARDQFRFTFVGRVLRIDSYADIARVPWCFWPSRNMPGRAGFPVGPDFEKLLARGVQAIYLTARGQWATRLPSERGRGFNRWLYGWDCASVLIMDPSTIRPSRKARR